MTKLEYNYADSVHAILLFILNKMSAQIADAAPRSPFLLSKPFVHPFVTDNYAKLEAVHAFLMSAG